MSNVSPEHLSFKVYLVDASICRIERLLQSESMRRNCQDTTACGDDPLARFGCPSVKDDHIWE